MSLACEPELNRISHGILPAVLKIPCYNAKNKQIKIQGGFKLKSPTPALLTVI